jgi:hypothetical protein
MKWTREIDLAPIEFDGDTVRLTVRRMLAEDMGAVLGRIVEGQPDKGESLKFGTAMLQKYVTSVSGLTQPDGTAVTLEEFREMVVEAYFMPLSVTAYGMLLAASSISQDQAKNSVSPPPVLSTENGEQESAGSAG